MIMCVEKNKAYITNHNTKSVLQENNVAWKMYKALNFFNVNEIIPKWELRFNLLHYSLPIKMGTVQEICNLISAQTMVLIQLYSNKI